MELPRERERDRERETVRRVFQQGGPEGAKSERRMRISFLLAGEGSDEAFLPSAASAPLGTVLSSVRASYFPSVCYFDVFHDGHNEGEKDFDQQQ